MELSPAYLEKMVVRVKSPDGRIMAKLEYPEDVTLGFYPGTYEGYSARSLEHQLSRLAALVWVGYRKGELMARSKLTGENVTDGPESWNANDRRYEKALAAIVSRGASPGGLITLEAEGLTTWRVRIREDALARTPEDEFTAETNAAVDALLLDHRDRMVLLKDRFFGLCIPASWREIRQPSVD